MKERLGTTGLVLNEALLWEKGGKGRCGFSLPRRDVEPSPIDEGLVGPIPDFPELSEVDVVRHYTRLSQWNYGVDTGMYPLGSCTMKYNPKINEKYASLPGFTGAHPLLPPTMVQGTLKLMYDLERFLSEITGMDATTLQPAFLIPDTAHGTNPASVSLCDFHPIPVKSNEDGILAPDAVAEVMDEDVAGILVTNPNTLGLFEENIREISEIVHGKGGLVYCDGANMNAVMGIVEMGKIGVDVMHVNLHKTFSTPHGGGGPGSGPVSVKKQLEPFLPVPRVVLERDTYGLSYDYPHSIGKVHGFYGNFGVMVKAYSYIMSMGPENLKKASQLAVLNANYVKESLKTVFNLPYDRPCMHECVFSDKRQNVHKITTLDMAKRLIDCGFHPPTIYFPLVVPGAIMVEPTESESKETLDEFIETCKAIANEAEETPDLLHDAPKNAKVRRLDEVTAARQPCLAD